MLFSDLALAGAPGLFRALSARVQSDVATYESDVAYGLIYEAVPSSAFVVRSLSMKLPYVRLDVSLAGSTIECRMKSKRSRASRGHDEPEPRRYRIASDAFGDVRVMKNGEPFEDESDLSEQILRPLFDLLP
jgi:hypothetical protein